MSFVSSVPLQLHPKLPCSQTSRTRIWTQRTPAVAQIRSSSSEPPPPLSLGETFGIYLENIRVLYGNKHPQDNVPLTEGDISDLTGEKPFFENLHRNFLNYGPIYKLAFGPKVFFVVQDPVMAKSILKDQSILYDKGVLSEVLEEIMGKGLIPADYATWKIRRRAIIPGFHKKWLNYMTKLMAECSKNLCDKLARDPSKVWDMELEYSSVALDIIGRAIFNYSFNSVKKESPVIKAVYRALKETEHRSMCVAPYWKIPGAKALIPRLRSFYADMDLINGVLSDLILRAKRNATSTDLTELENRDYEKVNDPSLLRFLVELRGEETTNSQLRDDLMTMLIAGHETTAAVLTWATWELTKNPEVLRRARAEVDSIIDDRDPTYDDVMRLPYVRRIIAETLRMYPAPPLLIRRLLADTALPMGAASAEPFLPRGSDVFINVYSLHRSGTLWDKPDKFDPDRWTRSHSNDEVVGWSGYSPAPGLEDGSPLYPSEGHADFAFLPFGGGARKCVGDSFAMLESVICLAMMIRRFDFELPETVPGPEMTTGATIHTKRGLNLRLSPRQDIEEAAMSLSQSNVRI